MVFSKHKSQPTSPLFKNPSTSSILGVNGCPKDLIPGMVSLNPRPPSCNYAGLLPLPQLTMLPPYLRTFAHTSPSQGCPPLIPRSTDFKSADFNSKAISSGKALYDQVPPFSYPLWVFFFFHSMWWHNFYLQICEILINVIFDPLAYKIHDFRSKEYFLNN